MKIKHVILTMIALITLGVSTLSLSNDRALYGANRFFIGGYFGQGLVDIQNVIYDNTGLFPFANRITMDHRAGPVWRLDTGYQFASRWGVQFGYMRFAKAYGRAFNDLRNNYENEHYQLQLVDLLLKYAFPFGMTKFSMYFVMGPAYVNLAHRFLAVSAADISNMRYVSFWRTSLEYGLGLQYMLNRNAVISLAINNVLLYRRYSGLQSGTPDNVDKRFLPNLYSLMAGFTWVF
ncbi:MAG: outer membrane beta-barrel protein [Coxiellaceae bacterium]|nr:outer membrane beta-barrel protein [Coxiellaceae bacterium]